MKEHLQNLLPTVKRARGYRLYAANGTRYIDFYLNGGRALAGHRPDGVLQVLKATAERGLWAEYPGKWRRKAEQLIQQLYPEVERVVFFSSLEAALEALKQQFESPVKIADTPFHFYSGEPIADRSSVVLRRPWAMSSVQQQKLAGGEYGPCFIPLIPFPGRFLPVPVCLLRSGTELGTPERRVSELSDPQLHSSILLHLLTRGLSVLQRMLQEEYSSKWQRFDLPGVSRFGPYLKFELEVQEYSCLYREMLNRGILLPPAQDIPAVIPFEFTEGEVLPLIKGCKESAWKR